MSREEGIRPEMTGADALASLPDPEGREARWQRWVLQTARRWSDVVGEIRLTELEPIDEEHRHLAELTLSLADILELAARRGLSLEEIAHQGQTLDRLRAAAADHFRREEQMIARFGLPQAEDQIREHTHFLSVLDDHIADFREGRLTSSGNMRGWLLEWLVTHGNSQDLISFRYENWTADVLARAASWDDVIDIVHFTDIAHLDGEHRDLIEGVLNLAEDLAERKPSASLLAVMDALATLADRHFRDEEMVIWAYDLPGRDLQAGQHEEMRGLLQAFRDKIAAETPPAADELRGVLLSWWLRHMNDIDGPSFSADAMAQTMFAQAVEWGDIASVVHETGLADIDAQHVEIGEAIIGLRALIQAPPGLDDLLAVFDALQARIEAHFVAEEAQFGVLDELAAKLHLEDHAALVMRVRNVREDFRFGRTILTESIRRSLLKEWIAHINRYDRQAFTVESAQ